LTDREHKSVVAETPLFDPNAIAQPNPADQSLTMKLLSQVGFALVGFG